MKSRWRFFYRQEDGQVLYPAIALIMVLALFYAVIVNIMGICIQRIKIQNAADQIVLSDATLKARILNQIAELNGKLYVKVQLGGVRRGITPFATDLELSQASLESWNGYIKVKTLLAEYQQRIFSEKVLDGLAEQNGLDLKHILVRVKPQIESDDLDMSWTGVSSLSTGTTLPVMEQIELKNPWYSQLRLIMANPPLLIGGERFGWQRQPLIVRARASVKDYPQTPMMSWGHHWRVILDSPDEGIDQELKNEMEF